MEKVNDLKKEVKLKPHASNFNGSDQTKAAYFIDDVYRERHQCKVIDYHWSFELEGFPIGHDTGSEVQYKEQVAQQYRRHGDRTLHEWITSNPRICGGGESRKNMRPGNRTSESDTCA